MRKKVKALLMGMAVMATLSAFPVYASETQNNNSGQETELLPAGTSSAKDVVTGIERSSIISSASTEIIDETGGDIGIIIETLCHVECDEILNLAILERLNEETGSWEEQSRYEFTALKEDFPTESLTSLTNAFTVENQDTGYYYRVRGIHSVSTPDDGGQVYSTRTSGLLITEYGR